MNSSRRRQLNNILSKVDLLKEELQSILNDEEEYKDNMPENLQGSEKFEKTESACEAMQEALDQLEEVINNIETAQE